MEKAMQFVLEKFMVEQQLIDEKFVAIFVRHCLYDFYDKILNKNFND